MKLPLPVDVSYANSNIDQAVVFFVRVSFSSLESKSGMGRFEYPTVVNRYRSLAAEPLNPAYCAKIHSNVLFFFALLLYPNHNQVSWTLLIVKNSFNPAFLHYIRMLPQKQPSVDHNQALDNSSTESHK
jgi:hypothetical protein